MSDLPTRLPPMLRALISRRGQPQHYAADEVLFHEGDASDGLYLLLSGRLKVYATASDGREVIYSVLEPGELLGELTLDGGARTASVRAMTDARCLVLANGDARALLRAQPEFAEHVLAMAAARARHSTRMARSIALDTVRDRVVALLEAHALPDGPVARIPTELTQQEIADRVGASRETVHKVIGALVRDGLLHKDAGHRMTLLKPPAGTTGQARRPRSAD
jgi:CRP/FNR family cyclic AMP-dependent transcriptional regulator